MVKKLCQLAYEFELHQSQRKSMQVVTSQCKSTHVGSQTKHNLTASSNLVLTCEPKFSVGGQRFPPEDFTEEDLFR